jgi:hypothetical protein
MIRVVLDTNILISAVLSPQGPPAQVFLMTSTLGPFPEAKEAICLTLVKKLAGN